MFVWKIIDSINSFDYLTFQDNKFIKNNISILIDRLVIFRTVET